ncbi:MAG: polysaccharide biosynthesis protein [Ruminococcaceae bacterium]|nr:polysaccharide biosynthesis protein [Oscillospiraceae bacterium]
MSAKARKGSSRMLSGVLALTIANLFVKTVGLLLKIPLREILNDDGMAYYNNAYDIYAFLYTVSNVGLPTAVSMMISENRASGNVRQSKKIMKVAMWLFVGIGLLGTSIMFFGAPLFENAYKINNLSFSIMAIAPTLFFICIASALKGYFQGYQNMVPSAISNVIEAVGKMALGILFANYAIGAGKPTYEVAAYAVFGLTLGVAAGMVSLIIRKLLFKPAKYDTEYADLLKDGMETSSASSIIKMLFAIAIPITLSSSVMTLSNVLDGVILSRGLQIYHTEKIARDLIGNLKTCVTPISNIILAFANPITSVIVPLISVAVAEGKPEKVKKTINTAFRMGVIVILPCVFGISVLAEPIIAFLFGADAAVKAGPLLSVHVISVFFMSMISTTAAVLQSHKLGKYPVISVAVGAIVKVISTLALVSFESINIMASPISAILSCFTISAMNFVFIRKKVGYTPNFAKLIIKPLIAALICACGAIGSFKLYYMITGIATVSLMLSILTAVIVYVLSILLIRGITREEVEMLPKGKKLARLLSKMKLLAD